MIRPPEEIVKPSGDKASMLEIIICTMGTAASVCAAKWLISPWSSAVYVVPSMDEVIHHRNPYQLGYLMGMTNGAIADSLVAREALKKFEAVHGYKATLRDAAMVVRLMGTVSTVADES